MAFDEKNNEKNQADASVLANQNRLEAEKKKIKVLLANKNIAIFEMKQAKAKASLARINLEDTTVLAPFDGVVANRQVQVGRYVRSGTTLLNLVDIQNVWLVANFKETQISNLTLNQEVTIKIDGLQEIVFLGTIESFSPGSGASFSMLPPDNATGNFVRVVQRVPVKIVFQSSEMTQKLLPGLSAEVSINLDEKG